MAAREKSSATKITDQQFDLFKKYVYQWQQDLGLGDWRIHVLLEKPTEEAYAETSWRTSSRVARVSLALEWTDRPADDANLMEVALHEVMHLVTCDLMVEAKDRYASEYDVDRAEHAIVVRMTSAIMRLHVKAQAQ